jgi:alpha-glucosidase
MQYVGEKKIDEVVLNVYYTESEVNSFLYEDHGDTFAYEQDIYSEKKFIVNGDASTLTIEQSVEGLYTPNYETYKYNVIGLTFEVRSITIDEKEISDFSFDGPTLHFKSDKKFSEIRITG